MFNVWELLIIHYKLLLDRSSEICIGRRQYIDRDLAIIQLATAAYADEWACSTL